MSVPSDKKNFPFQNKEKEKNKIFQAEIFKKISKIEIKTRKIVNSLFSGDYQSSYKGRGMEFDEVREYIPGDDVRNIDWNVTARNNQAYVKQFKEERELINMILLDASASNHFGTGDITRQQVSAEISAALAFTALKNNDKTGLIIFTQQIELYIPPRKGRSHILRIIREILYFRPKGIKTDINVALELINNVQKKRGIIFLISDLMTKGYDKALKLASKKHDINVIQIIDIREREFCDVGLIQLQDAETDKTILVDTSSKLFKKNYLKSNNLRLDYYKKKI